MYMYIKRIQYQIAYNGWYAIKPNQTSKYIKFKYWLKLLAQKEVQTFSNLSLLIQCYDKIGPTEPSSFGRATCLRAGKLNSPFSPIHQCS